MTKAADRKTMDEAAATAARERRKTGRERRRLAVLVALIGGGISLMIRGSFADQIAGFILLTAASITAIAWAFMWAMRGIRPPS